MLGPVVLDLRSTSLAITERSILLNRFVGGVILFSRNFQSVAQLQDLIAEIRGLRDELIICVDQEGGRVQRFREGFTRLPALQQLGKLYAHNPSKGLFVAHKCAWLMASELQAAGVDISFAPVVDADECFSEVIGDRSFSPNVECVSALAQAYIRGMHDAGMGATLKHFPGHGHVKGDSHNSQPVDHRTLDQVESSDMVPFIDLLPIAEAVMPAHIRYPLIDEHSVGFSPYWLQTILRKKLGFSGIVFSDDLSMAGASVVGNHIDRARAALAAGCDGILVCNDPGKVDDVLEWLERENKVVTNTLAVLRAKQPACGLAALTATAAWSEAVRIVKGLESFDARS